MKRNISVCAGILLAACTACAQTESFRIIPVRPIEELRPKALAAKQPHEDGTFLKPDLMGKITSIDAHMYRNTAHGKPQWSRPIYPDMTSENIVWSSFLGEAPKRDFDANRYINWRFFWDYSTITARCST